MTTQQRREHLVLLHGFAATSFTWRRQVGPLGEHHEVTTLDRQWVPAADAANATVTALQELEGRQVVLVGHSAGAEIALRVAEAAPERVKGLVLLAPVVGGGPPTAVRLLAQVPGSDLVAGPLLRAATRWTAQGLGRTVFDREAITPEVVDGYRLPLVAPGTSEALWSMTRRYQDDGFAARVRGIDQHALVIIGSRDRWASQPPLPNATVKVLDRCGHLPHEEHPTVVTEEILAFCRLLSALR